MSELRAALEQIYRTCRQQLFTSALSVTRCPERAEDAVHEAFSRLLRMERTPRDLKVYVFRAVRNAAVDQLARRESASDERSIFAPGEGPEDVAGRREARLRVEEALDALPEHERQVVTLRLYADLTFREVARLCGAPEGTVAAWYYRALRKMRRQLEDCCR